MYWTIQGWVINVWNCRAQVGLWLPREGKFIPAQNWEELEAEAIEAVEGLGGARNLSGIYICPASLAEKAVVDEEAWGS